MIVDEGTLWAPPVPCGACGNPMPRGMDLCPGCGEPRGLALGVRLRRLGPALGALAAEALVLGLVMAGGFALLPFSPLLVLFPLVLVGSGVRHRRQARRHRRRTFRRRAGGP